MSLRIVPGGLDDPQVLAMLSLHFDTNVSVTPKGSAHVFDVSRSNRPILPSGRHGMARR